MIRDALAIETNTRGSLSAGDSDSGLGHRPGPLPMLFNRSPSGAFS
jgi:hypothetical protein